MNGGHRAFVTGVHRLKHVERLFAAYLANNDAVRTHTQAVDEQLPLADGSVAFDIGRPGFKAHDVLLRKLQFSCIFDRDNAFVLGNVLRQDIEKCGLAGARAAGDDEC